VVDLFLLHMVALSEATAAGYPGAPLFALFWAAAWVVGGRVREWREGIAQLEQRAPRDRARGRDFGDLRLDGLSAGATGVAA
jgi:hypothetical protein